MKRLFRIFQKKKVLLDQLSDQWLLKTAPRNQTVTVKIQNFLSYCY